MEIKFDDPRKMGRILNGALEKVRWKNAKKDFICLNKVLNQTWENIETAIIAAAKKTVPYLQIKKTVKAKRQKTAIAKAAIALEKLICEDNQIRHINYLTETKVNKFSHSRENLEGWLTEAYTWRKALEGKLTTKSERVKSTKIKGFVQRHAKMIISEQKKMLTSLLKRPFNKVSLDHLLVKENDQISLATEPKEWDEMYSLSVRIEKHWYDTLSEPITIEEWNQILQENKTNSASGSSSIYYSFIKQAGLKAQIIFKNFADLCLKLGK
ncbi:24474_t:CDS:2, partial [Gigaspora margarita]